MARVYDWANSVSQQPPSVEELDKGSSNHLDYIPNHKIQRRHRPANGNGMTRSKSMSATVMAIGNKGLTTVTPPQETPVVNLPEELQQRPSAPPPYRPPPSYMRATGSKKPTSKSYSSLAIAGMFV